MDFIQQYQSVRLKQDTGILEVDFSIRWQEVEDQPIQQADVTIELCPGGEVYWRFQDPKE